MVSFLPSTFSPAARLKSVDNKGDSKVVEMRSEPLVLSKTLPGLLFNVEPSAPVGVSSTGKA